MSVSENQIVVYQPNETVRLDVRSRKCCQCENVASANTNAQSADAKDMAVKLENGNIGIGNTSTLATLFTPAHSASSDPDLHV